MSDAHANLWKLLGKSDPFVNDRHSFDAGTKVMIEVMPLVDIVDARIKAIRSGIEQNEERIEVERRKQAAARREQGRLIRLGGQLRTLLHETTEARKALLNV